MVYPDLLSTLLYTDIVSLSIAYVSVVVSSSSSSCYHASLMKNKEKQNCQNRSLASCALRSKKSETVSTLKPRPVGRMYCTDWDLGGVI